MCDVTFSRSLNCEETEAGPSRFPGHKSRALTTALYFDFVIGLNQCFLALVLCSFCGLMSHEVEKLEAKSLDLSLSEVWVAPTIWKGSQL
jgi:hypothetical protein